MGLHLYQPHDQLKKGLAGCWSIRRLSGSVCQVPFQSMDLAGLEGRLLGLEPTHGLNPWIEVFTLHFDDVPFFPAYSLSASSIHPVRLTWNTQPYLSILWQGFPFQQVAMSMCMFKNKKFYTPLN